VADRSLLFPVSLAVLAACSLAWAAGPDPEKPPARSTEAPVGSAEPATTTTTEAPVPIPEPQTPGSPTPNHPPPLHVEYAQYGIALNALVTVNAGAMCGGGVHPSGAPCILGSGGGLIVRAGYRSPGPWYVGGAYSFAKTDSSNLFRLGIFQQLWAELRYLPDTGYRVAPFVTGGLGGAVYGNEWGVETGGAMLALGAGLQLEVSRVAVIGLGIGYKPTLIAGWTDTAGFVRPLGVAHFVGLELQLEVRSEIGRR
jgi:hypothetical protein